MSIVYIFCDGGLGNRLGSLFGGLHFSMVNNKSPMIIWPENNWCGCSFKDLFDSDIPNTDWGINLAVNNKSECNFIVHDFSQIKYPVANIEENNFKTSIKYKNTNNDIFYYHNIIPDYIDTDTQILLLKSLKINSNILNKVNNFLEPYKEQIITGLHFRKTDFRTFLDEDYYDKIIKQNLDKIFFVCSDDKQTELKFKLNKNVITFEKNNYVNKLIDSDWNASIVDSEGRSFIFNVNRSRESVIEAFIDMLILSKTNIITENSSTFLNFAKLYGKSIQCTQL